MDESNSFNPRTITRPDPALWKYYMLTCLFAGPFFPFLILPLYFRYKTIEYKFDDSGISMKWGIFFRKEINLTYRRIQDIHLTRNIFQRWMGLATVAIQTASGSSGPEMSIEGILKADELRDYLYRQMRGAQDDSGHDKPAAQSDDRAAQALGVLEEIRDLLKTKREGAVN